MTEGPTTRRRRLGLRLLALRERTGLSAEEAGIRAGVSKATVSRYERAKGAVRWNQVDQLCRAYEASDEEREALVELAKSSQVTDGWWVPKKLEGPLGTLIPMEQEATRISQYSVVVVPGLLQTRAYASSIKLTPGHDQPPEDVNAYLDMRMQRQQILDAPEPPRYEVVLDEAVIRRSAGGPEVMAAQLEHLLERGKAPHISIQILSFGAGLSSAALNSFMVLGGEDPSLDVIYAENTAGSLYLEGADAIQEFTASFAYLRDEALSPDSSAELIAEAGKMHLRS